MPQKSFNKLWRRQVYDKDHWNLVLKYGAWIWKHSAELIFLRVKEMKNLQCFYATIIQLKFKASLKTVYKNMSSLAAWKKFQL